MTKSQPIRRGKCPSEEGYVLVAVIFMMAILILSLSVALPRVRESIQRDREVETMQRGKQYIRAIRLYYKKFNAYPPNIDALVKTNDIRFLRKKYVDPTTGKEEWKPVLFGQNKTPTAMGFFGQPLSGTSIAGIGPSGNNGATNGPTTGIGSTSSFGSTTISSSGDSGTGSTTGTGTTSGGTTGGTDSNGNPIASPGGTTTTSPATGQTGQTFGGAGIIGFSPGSPKQSILVYKKKNHYNDWEFVYDPIMERMLQGGGNSGNGAGLNNGTNNGTTTGITTTTPTTPNPTPTPQQ